MVGLISFFLKLEKETEIYLYKILNVLFNLKNFKEKSPKIFL